MSWPEYEAGLKENRKTFHITFPDPLHHVMEMSHTKEEWTDDDGPEMRIVT